MVIFVLVCAAAVGVVVCAGGTNTTGNAGHNFSTLAISGAFGMVFLAIKGNHFIQHAYFACSFFVCLVHCFQS